MKRVASEQITPHPSLPEHCLVRLTQGYETVIFRDDMDLALEHLYQALQASHHVYAARMVVSNGRRSYVFLQDEIAARLSFPDYLTVDHIDRDSLNNARTNLRPVTRGQSNVNRRTWSSLGRCVQRNGNSYEVRLRKNGKIVYRAKFQNLHEAQADATVRHKELWGEASPL